MLLSRVDSTIHPRPRGSLTKCEVPMFADRSLRVPSQVTELESTAHFPEEMESLRRVMKGVVDHNNLRQQLTADMADSSHRYARTGVGGMARPHFLSWVALLAFGMLDAYVPRHVPVCPCIRTYIRRHR